AAGHGGRVLSLAVAQRGGVPHLQADFGQGEVAGPHGGAGAPRGRGVVAGGAAVVGAGRLGAAVRGGARARAPQRAGGVVGDPGRDARRDGDVLGAAATADVLAAPAGPAGGPAAAPAQPSASPLAGTSRS